MKNSFTLDSVCKIRPDAHNGKKPTTKQTSKQKDKLKPMAFFLSFAQCSYSV